MEEYIGDCKYCQRAIYCENGFFNGVVLNENEYCFFECEEKYEDTSSIYDAKKNQN